MKRFNYNRQLQFCMYDFMNIDPQTMAEEDYFPATTPFVAKYKKIPNPGLVPKHWLGFSYISSEDYDLHLNFDAT